MRLYLCVTLCMAVVSLQAADIVQSIDASYDRLISVSDSVDIDKADQIVLPVAYGQSINIPLDIEDVFSYDSVRNMIKEVKDSDEFYVLASYRTKQPDAKASYIKCARAAQLVRWLISRNNEDPLTRLPIKKIDFHEFCFINDRLAIRYLGNLKDLSGPSAAMLHCAVSNPLQDSFSPGVSMNLALVHANKGDFGRAYKYVKHVSEDYAKEAYRAIAQIAYFALQKNENELAIQALNKCSFHEPHSTFLLYKIQTDADQDFLKQLSAIVVGSFERDCLSEIRLSNILLSEAVTKGIDSPMGADFFMLATIQCKHVADKHKDVYAMVLVFRALGIIPEDKYVLFASDDELHTYANKCIDAINKGDCQLIVRMKNEAPMDYYNSLQLIKKYGTTQLKS